MGKEIAPFRLVHSKNTTIHMRRAIPPRLGCWLWFFIITCLSCAVGAAKPSNVRQKTRQSAPSKLNLYYDFNPSGSSGEIFNTTLPFLKERFEEVNVNNNKNVTHGYEGFEAVIGLQDLPKNGEHMAVIVYPDFFFFRNEDKHFDESKVEPIYAVCSHPVVLLSKKFPNLEELLKHVDGLPSGEKYPICSPSANGGPRLTQTILERKDKRAKRLDFHECFKPLVEGLDDGSVPVSYLGVPLSLKVSSNVSILGVTSPLPLPHLPEAPLFQYNNVPDDKTSVSLMLYISSEVPKETKLALTELLDSMFKNSTIMHAIRAHGTTPLFIKYPETLEYTKTQRNYVKSVMEPSNALYIGLGVGACLVAIIPVLVIVIVFAREYHQDKNDPTGVMVDEKLQDMVQSDTTQGKIVRILTLLRNEAPPKQQVLFNRALLLLSSDVNLVEAPSEGDEKFSGDDEQFSIKDGERTESEDFSALETVPSGHKRPVSLELVSTAPVVDDEGAPKQNGRRSSFDAERKFIESFAGKVRLNGSSASSEGNTSSMAGNASTDSCPDSSPVIGCVHIIHSDSFENDMGSRGDSGSFSSSYSDSLPRSLPVDSEEQNIAFIIKLGPELDKWDYSPAWLQRVSHGHPLRFAFVYFVHRFRLSNRWPLQLMSQWADAIENMYFDYNAFHTSLHAADTLQAAAYLATLPAFDNLLTRNQLFCLLVGCAIHDVGHVARTNAFLAQTGHPYAITYSDTAVLESMSLAKSFQFMLSHPRLNLLSRMSKPNARAFRALLIEIVLATDLAQHFTLIDRAKHRLAVSAFDSSCAPLLLDIIIKCADISNAARPFAIAERWSQSLLEEFYSQGEEEQMFGLPMSNFMDRNNPQVSKSQSVFYKAIVAPLFACFSTISGDHSFEDTVLENLKKWESMPDVKPSASLRWFHKHGVGEPKQSTDFVAPAPKTTEPAATFKSPEFAAPAPKAPEFVAPAPKKRSPQN